MLLLTVLAKRFVSFRYGKADGSILCGFREHEKTLGI